MKRAPKTLLELLRQRAFVLPRNPAFHFLTKGETEGPFLDYGNLDERARAIGAWLQENRIRRAVLVYPPGLDFIEAFFGCLYAGTLPVIPFPPDSRKPEQAEAFKSLVEDSQSQIVLTSSDYPAERISGKQGMASDQIPALLAPKWREPSVGANDPAFLQYTSGTTASPKGIMVSNRNVLSNLELIRLRCGLTTKDRTVFWVPQYHNVGLVTQILGPLYAGFPAWMMPPESFLERPARWLEAISRYRATICLAPNFGYQLCARLVSPEEVSRLDLRCWRMATTGGETVSPETIDHFSRVFRSAGFRASSFQPGYGLGEATSVVAAKAPKGRPFRLGLDEAALQEGRVRKAKSTKSAYRLVSCGRVGAGTRALVVDPQSLSPCPSRRIGEIWLSGPGVAQGYWRRSEETKATFQAHLRGSRNGRYLRTGDLGFLHRGELFITGRLKDLIIIRGKNYYPQDIEQTMARAHPSIRPYGCSAFSEPVTGGGERLVVAAEVERRSEEAGEHLSRRTTPALPLDPRSIRSFDAQATVAALRKAIAERHGLQAHAVLLLQAGSIEKTGSGKVRRQACRSGYLEKSLKLVHEDVLSQDPQGLFHSNREFRLREIRTAAGARRQALLRELLRQDISRIMGLPVGALVDTEPLTHWGLDSLNAVQIRNRIAEDWGVVVGFDDLLKGMTLSLLARKIGRETEKTHAPSPEPHALASPDEEFPLVAGQQALWFLHQMDKESPAYNLFYALKIPQGWTPQTVRNAVARLVFRHPILRTTYREGGKGLMQRIQGPELFHFEEIDAQDWTDRRLQDRMESESDRPFDLEQGPLFRTHLFFRRHQPSVLLLTAHHIALDFWSLDLLVHELLDLCRTGEDVPRTPDLRYRDFVEWQERMVNGPAGERHWEYWRRELAGETPVLLLPADRPRPKIQSTRGKSHYFTIAPSLTRRLKSFASREEVTPYMVLLSALGVLFHRYTGQENILIGTPFVGRSRAEFEKTIGYFVNPLPVRMSFTGDPSFRTILSGVRAKVLKALSHQDYPFPLLVKRLQPERDPSHPPLFQVLFAWETPREHFQKVLWPSDKPRKAEAEEISLLSLGQRGAPFDLELIVLEAENSLKAVFQYNSDLFAEETIARMAGHLEILLSGIVSDPMQSVASLPLLPRAERRQILQTWNQTTRPYPKKKCLHRLFEEAAEKHPGKTAVICGELRLTYRELNERADRLADRLRDAGARPGTLVGICLDRSIDLIVGLLGILKSGAAYVPLDPAYPPARIHAILDDSQPKFILTQEKWKDRMSGGEGGGDRRKVVILDGPASASGTSRHRPRSRSSSGDLAYVIYTSGSTGRPKGVAIEHRSAVALVSWARETFSESELRGVLAATSICFDLSIFEIFVPLSAGQSVILAENVLQLPDLPAKEKITLVNTVPSAMAEILRMGKLPKSVRTVNLAGEPLPTELVDSLYRTGYVRKVYDLYGPSEDTTYSTFTLREAGQSPTIGRPIANTRVYLLDRNLHPVPIGVPGEICISGDGLARCYLNAPELTRRKFIPNPMEPGNKSRLYKTGDLGRYLADGRIEFIGRNDHQVKIRGFRIELGEVEACLRRHESVDQAICSVADGPGGKTLVAYVVPKRGSAVPSGFVSAWKGVFEEAYREPVPGTDPRFDVSGWRSSVNGEPFPEEEMREWLDHTVERICSLKPERVLEIGCGTGLLVFRIAPFCRQYIATDISINALNGIRREMRSDPSLSHVITLERSADDFKGLEGLQFDAVILNSVVQYFPDVDYLVRVLEKALGVLAPGGSVFLGDLRSLPLHEAFCRFVEEAKEPDLSPRELEERVGRRAAAEKELLIDPQFFKSFRNLHTRVGEVQVQLKQGRAANELIRFRYDVLLRADVSNAGESSERGDRTDEETGSIDWNRYANNPSEKSAFLLSAPLRAFIRERLPEYMVPSHFVFLEKIPLTPNGKTDRKALPPPEAEREATEASPDIVDPLEMELRAVWEEILRVRPIGLRDNFFELGGHSLLAVTLLSRIQDVWGVPLPLAAFFEEPTIERQALLLRGLLPGEAATSLVPIQSEGARRPFFCVHPVGGTVFCYRELAEALGKDRPFYGLQSPGVWDGARRLLRLEEMAATYLEEIRRRQPHGPYLLGGWSMGGLVAQEMARQLAEREEEADVVLIDAAADFAGMEGSIGPKAFELFLAHLTGVIPEGISWNGEGSPPLKEIHLEMRRRQLDLPNFEAFERLYRVFEDNLKALREHSPKPFVGKTVLIQAEESWAIGREASLKAWEDILPGRFTVEKIPGNHFTILQRPNVGFLAEILKRFDSPTE